MSSLLQRLSARLPFLDRLVPMPPVVSLVRLEGVIAAGRGQRALNLSNLDPVLTRAFKLPRRAAVALIVNSPGGSAAQSALIGSRIRQLADEEGVKVIAFVEDAAASGGYWLACAADEIIAAEPSIIGSIGVIYAGFGFHDAIARIGVERRVYTAGRAKSVLDPFLAEKPEDVARLGVLQSEIHGQFIAWVKARRGAKLKGDDAELFNGEFWTGAAARERGLVDDLGTLHGVLQERFGRAVRIARFEARPRWRLPVLGGLAQRAPVGATPTPGALSGGFGAELAEGLLTAAEERAWWARLGL
jgi:signal peptide peptidase SppA